MIHAHWTQHHRGPVAGTHTGTCTITTGPATPGTWDPDTGVSDGTPSPLFTGACAIGAQQRPARQADAAGQLVTPSQFLIGLDLTDAPDVPNGARVTITACAGDPGLVGKVFLVKDAAYDSTTLERVLACDLDPTNQPTG